jgi:hypothetical protein
MKNSHLIAVLAAALSLSSVAFANCECPTEEGGEKLVAAKVVNPSELPPNFTRSVVDIRFSLNEHGQPQDVKVVTPLDEQARKQVVKAFKKWRFDVAGLDSHSPSRRYVLPLDIIPQA